VPRNFGGEHLAGEQVGLRVRADVGHEVEQHEADENHRGLGGADEIGGHRGNEQSGGAPMKPSTWSQMRPDAIRQDDREGDADDQQCGDHGRALGGEDVVPDQVADAADVIGGAAQGGGQDGRREDADAVGAEVLDEPGHRGEDGGAAGCGR